MIEYNPENQEQVPKVGRSSICVVGVGGAGANVLDRIALENTVDAELLSMNTDIRALTNAVSSKKLQLGAEITRGLGAGGDPDLGRESARHEEAVIREALKGRTMVFICTGLGGGTGSGAAPYIARIAQDMGAFVVSFATMPFTFEGKRRVDQANAALAELEDASSALITFENDRMGQLALSKNGIQEAFATADRVISQSVRAVTMLVTQPGIIRIGMDDLMTALKNTESRCLFGYGSAKGRNRAQEALKEAMKSPLLDRGKMLDHAASVLVHIAGGDSMTLYEVELLMKALGKHVSDDAHILFGVATDEKLGESLTVTVITSVAGPKGSDPTGTDSPTKAMEAEQGDEAPKTTSGVAATTALASSALTAGSVAASPPSETIRAEVKSEPAEAPKKSQQPETFTQAPATEEVTLAEIEEKKTTAPRVLNEKAAEPDIEPKAETKVEVEEEVEVEVAKTEVKQEVESLTPEEPVEAKPEPIVKSPEVETPKIEEDTRPISEKPVSVDVVAPSLKHESAAETPTTKVEVVAAVDQADDTEAPVSQKVEVKVEVGVEVEEPKEVEAEVAEPVEVPKPSVLGINLLPKVFSMTPPNLGDGDDIVVDEPSKSVPQSLEVGEDDDASDDVAEPEAEEKISVIASFIDRSKISKGIEAVAEPVKPTGQADGGTVSDEVSEPKSAPAPLPKREPVAHVAPLPNEVTSSKASADQTSLDLEKGKSGRFSKGEPTIIDGEDIDVPTFLRRKG